MTDFDGSEIIIFKGSFPQSTMMTPPTLKSIMGMEYIVDFEDNKFIVNCAGAWQSIEKYNILHSTYVDASEGIQEFDDEELEQMGWYAIDFEITYRELADIIESSCDMFMLCSEIQEGKQYMFSGLAFVNDIECAREKAREHIKQKITTLLKEDTQYSHDSLDIEQLKALVYFDIKV